MKTALTTLSLLVLAGCASTGKDNAVLVANDLAFDLLSPASLGQQLVLTQVVTITYQQQAQQLLFYSEVNADAITIAGLLPDGTRLFSIHYDGAALQSEGNTAVLQRLDPHYLLADMQLALWPLAELRKGFAAADCFAQGSCQLLESADELTRSLNRDGNAVVVVRYTDVPHYGATTDYEHRDRSYRLQIETVNVELLDQTTP